ncbi:MAG: Holliday junction resolvase RuvX [Actinomycetota bacterium]
MADSGHQGPDAPRSKGRVLGLDLGQARIGVAVSDPDRRVAVAVGTVHTGAPADLKAIAKLVREYDAAQVVVGHPISLSGRKGEAADQAEQFATALEQLLDVPVALQDERLSTVEAERNLAAAGLKGRERRAVVDETAAVVILQAYLDRMRR